MQISLMSDMPGITITCYAGDICIHSISPDALQAYLQYFNGAAADCGLGVSPEKSRLFTTIRPGLLPQFRVGTCIIPLGR